MNAMIVLLSLFVQLPAALQVAETLPGSAYSIPAQGTVLRAGPGADFPGVLTLDGETVVRLGGLRGTFREIYVPHGFDVYMHGDYVRVSPGDATVVVSGDHVNMRLRPSTDGLMPVATVGAGTGPLVYLGRSGDWVHVLAPLAVPLFAPDETVAATDRADAADVWRALHARREQQRLASVEGARATDPEWQRESQLHQQVEDLAAVDLSQVDEVGRKARRVRLDELSAQTEWPETRALIERLRQDLDKAEGQRETSQRETTERAVETLQKQETLDVTVLQRESKTLALGWRYTGRGDAVVRRGSVHREGLDGAPVYTLHSTDGEILKLTAAREVATLEALVGKQVEFNGRRLFLSPVNGPVLVVDRVVSYHP